MSQVTVPLAITVAISLAEISRTKVMRKFVVSFVVLASVAATTPVLAQGVPSAVLNSHDVQNASETDLPWGTTLKQAPSGNTAQSTYSPYNLQVPQEYCSRMPVIAGRAPTECVPTHPRQSGWLTGWLFG
jgi:hypothetical protein